MTTDEYRRLEGLSPVVTALSNKDRKHMCAGAAKAATITQNFYARLITHEIPSDNAQQLLEIIALPNPLADYSSENFETLNIYFFNLCELVISMWFAYRGVGFNEYDTVALIKSVYNGYILKGGQCNG